MENNYIKEFYTINCNEEERLLLRYEDETFNLTLLLGPMYHLFTDNDKKKYRNY